MPGTIYLRSYAVKVSALTRRYAEERGWFVIKICQPEHLFPKDGRKLNRVPIPTDPWLAAIGDRENYLEATHVRHAKGASPDDAVLAAIPHDIRASMRRLEMELDNLGACLQKLLREEQEEPIL